MMQKILVGLIATIGSFVALILLQPSDYRITRAITIAAPIQARSTGELASVASV